ncbi:protein of unknown function [Oscillibacter sp. PC13]|uniref:DUF4352 domain-containing protein n=1 Tax=Oscillibacter sp. PC13 TaxID=1855299 RepID=UPI0008EFE551|nr:DUF4352 domain-containing protein [Oscillibacter sp. PC13]SFP68442.1 protein of unknown function [Oscillibacter sp. PC13]
MAKRALIPILLALVLLTGCGQKEGYAKDGYGEGGMGDTMHTYFFDYTVNSADTRDEFEGYTPVQEGYVLLVADVTVKNTGTSGIVMYDTDFQVQWNQKSEYDVPITYYTDHISDEQLPTEYELAADEERSGLLIFEVPAGKNEFTISYLERFEDGTDTGEKGDAFCVSFQAAPEI